MQPIWTDYIAVAALWLLIALVCIGAVIFVYLRFFEKADTEYDSAIDWPTPPERRRERSNWQHMSAEERRARFERDCG